MSYTNASSEEKRDLEDNFVKSALALLFTVRATSKCVFIAANARL